MDMTWQILKRKIESGGWGVAFVAILRIAIGWHFLYEGLWKLM